MQLVQDEAVGNGGCQDINPNECSQNLGRLATGSGMLSGTCQNRLKSLLKHRFLGPTWECVICGACERTSSLVLPYVDSSQHTLRTVLSRAPVCPGARHEIVSGASRGGPRQWVPELWPLQRQVLIFWVLLWLWTKFLWSISRLTNVSRLDKTEGVLVTIPWI